MNISFAKVKEYLLTLDYTIVSESPEDGMLIIENEEMGIKDMVIGCADPLLIMEQYIFEIKHKSMEVYENLLQKNRDIIHGAFVLDETGTKVIFRDTLQLENLDLNELEASFNSLGLLLSEYSEEIIRFSKQ
jgi:hypothetical protein